MPYRHQHISKRRTAADFQSMLNIFPGFQTYFHNVRQISARFPTVSRRFPGGFPELSYRFPSHVLQCPVFFTFVRFLSDARHISNRTRNNDQQTGNRCLQMSNKFPADVSAGAPAASGQIPADCLLNSCSSNGIQTAGIKRFSV